MKSCERSRAGPQSVKSASRSAACRGLYDTQAHRTAKHKQKVAHLAQSLTPDHTNAVKGDDDKNDPIIKFSIYPQMIGKRRSELEAMASTRPTRHAQKSTEAHHHRDTIQLGRPKHWQLPLSRVRSRSAGSDFSFGSEYSSGGNPEGLPVRVCIYPQAKYIKEPVKKSAKLHQDTALPFNKSSCPRPSSWTPSSRTFKQSTLPGDEYQILVRRQKMQRAREVLELHYAHRGPVRAGRIRHGMMQGFTTRNSERRHVSKMQYAVRKALRAGLNLLDEDFRLALNRRADKAYFCELSDVDGLPIDEHMVYEFIRLYHAAQDAAYAAKVPAFPRTQTVQCTWIDERNHRIRQLALQRADGFTATEAPGKRPRLVSKFSWDSSDEAASRQ